MKKGKRYASSPAGKAGLTVTQALAWSPSSLDARFCSKVDAVGVGLNATDTLIHLQQFPARGFKVEYDREQQQPGGQVASAMVACATWGLCTPRHCW